MLENILYSEFIAIALLGELQFIAQLGSVSNVRNREIGFITILKRVCFSNKAFCSVLLSYTKFLEP